jgi:hypothetical protein
MEQNEKHLQLMACMVKKKKRQGVLLHALWQCAIMCYPALPLPM